MADTEYTFHSRRDNYLRHSDAWYRREFREIVAISVPRDAVLRHRARVSFLY